MNCEKKFAAPEEKSSIYLGEKSPIYLGENFAAAEWKNASIHLGENFAAAACAPVTLLQHFCYNMLRWQK